MRIWNLPRVETIPFDQIDEPRPIALLTTTGAWEAVADRLPPFVDRKAMHLPEATRACEHEAVWFDESIFRAGRQGVEDAVAALQKIQENAAELAAVARELDRSA